MNIKTLCLALVFCVHSGFSLAESVHLPQAIEHTKTAITHGEASNHGGIEHVPLLVSNINTALEHAKASEKAEANPHTVEGIIHLEAAINATKQDDVKSGTLHAKEALKHLEMAQEPKVK
jgi:hypothetical protein